MGASEPLDGKLWVTRAVVDDVVYVTTFDRTHILGSMPLTAAVLPWVFQFEFGFVSSPLVVDDMVYVASFNRSLVAVPLGADAPAWQFQAGNWFWAKPAVADGVLYAPSLDGKLYALDAKTGAQVWVAPYDAGESIAASPVFVGDTIVIVTKKGDVHIVNAPVDSAPACRTLQREGNHLQR